MPLFHRGRRDAQPAHTSVDFADSPILAHDRQGRLRHGPTAVPAIPVAHADASLFEPALRTYTYGGKQYAYYDPSFHYDREHERNLSVHPKDVVDPYLRTHLKDIRYKAAHGRLGPNDPALAGTLLPEERLDLFEPKYMGTTRRRRRFAEDAYPASVGETLRETDSAGTHRLTTRRARKSHSVGRDYGRRERSPSYYHEGDATSRYPRSDARAVMGSNVRSSSLFRPVGNRSDSVYDETFRRHARSSSVPAQHYGSALAAHTRLSYSTTDALPYGTASRGTSLGPTLAAYGHSQAISASATNLSQHDHGAGFADLITDRTEPVVFHPTSAAGKGTLECDHGANVALGAKQSLPYNPNELTTTTVSGPPLANRALSAPATAGVLFHADSLTSAHVPGHTVLKRTGSGTYDRTSAGGLREGVPTTTVAALDRANRIALAEAEANRPVSYTKVGPVTFVHNQDRRYGNQSRMATLTRARMLGVGRTHTTTEMAIMRSNAIASAEMAREQNSRRAVTKIGSLLTLSR